MLNAATDDLNIPPFLVVTPKEQERRNAWHAKHPIKPQQFAPLASHGGSMTDEEIAKRREAERAAAKAASYDRIAKLKSNQEAKAAAAEGLVWHNGRFEKPDAISRARFDRIYDELPTASMRAHLVDRYAHRVPGGWTKPVADKPKKKRK